MAVAWLYNDRKEWQLLVAGLNCQNGSWSKARTENGILSDESSGQAIQLTQ
jgi:hypothetical protein